MICLSKQQKEDIGLRFVLDRLNTCTPYGAELVSELKPFTPDEKDQLTEELDNIGRIKDAYSSPGFTEILHILSQFKDIRPAVKKCIGTDYVLNEVELFEIKNFLLSLEELDEALIKLQDALGLTCALPRSMPPALALLDPEGGRLRTFYIADSATHKLFEIRAEKRRLEAAITASDNEENKRLLRDKRLLAVNAEEDEELVIRRKLTAGIFSHADNFFSNASAIGHLDLLMQKGALAAENKTVRPVISESGSSPVSGSEVVFDGVYNPYIAWLLKKSGKEFTPVSVKLRRGTAILTGANMGGKSVALKTFTLNIMLFQMGFYVFAEKAILPLFDNVHLISEDPQSADRGLSSFAAEVVKLRHISSDLERGFSFIALDEFARGTNPREGSGLVRAVALYLNGKNSVSILTTHYDNICSKEFNNYQVIGLKNLDIEKLRQNLHPGGENSAALIAGCMDFRLEKSDEDPPKDAVNICKLLNLSGEILDLLNV